MSLALAGGADAVKLRWVEKGLRQGPNGRLWYDLIRICYWKGVQVKNNLGRKVADFIPRLA
jgi:hypothetical protein